MTLKCPFGCTDDETIKGQLTLAAHFRLAHEYDSYELLAEMIAAEGETKTDTIPTIISCTECKNKVAIENLHGKCEECDAEYDFIDTIPKSKIRELIEKLEDDISNVNADRLTWQLQILRQLLE